MKLDIEQIKRHYWLIAGCALGLALGYAWSSAPPAHDPIMRLPMTADRFVARIQSDHASLRVTLRALKIYPSDGGRQMITGEAMSPDAWTPFVVYLSDPFRPAASSPPTDPREFLATTSGTDFKYVWWRSKWFGPMVGILAGLLLIGGLWPAMVKSMVRSGMGRKQVVEDAPIPEVPAPEPEPVVDLPSPEPSHVAELDQEVEASLQAKTPEPPAIQNLDATALQPLAPAEDDPDKEYGGEFYPVARPAHPKDPKAFTLIELLVVIGIIGVLLGFLLPSLHRAQEAVAAIKCASNVRQLGHAMQMYFNDYDGQFFWRGAHLDTDGMDWYVYGGRETGNLNLAQAGLFNHTVPRPLNKYLSDAVKTFRCPNDNEAPWTLDPGYTPYPAPSEYEWVGNSYAFNANGYPLRPVPQDVGGLDGVKITALSSSSQTIVFYDASLYWGFDWHYSHKANIGFADGHVEFLPLPDQFGDLHWNP